MAKFKDVAPAQALKHFKGRGIKVQVAEPVKVRGDDGKVREAFETTEANLGESHILSAKHWDDGRLSITTIDGKRHEISGVAIADATDDGKTAK